jgi:hypothetical protein
MADVFISYKRAERARVQQVYELLRAEGLDVWFDARLEVGRGEGFDAEIEREVTSAACVLVCWTPEALRSIYVKGEAKKGLERQVLVPVFLESCTLPVPFNGVDTADLVGWSGDPSESRWQAVLGIVKSTVTKSKADEKQRAAHSLAAYERVPDKIYPGTLRLLVNRIVAQRDTDAWNYHDDIRALLEWLASLADKAARYSAGWYEFADRQSGGSAWYAWEKGEAAAQSAKLSEIRESLKRIDDAIVASQRYLDRPAP